MFKPSTKEAVSIFAGLGLVVLSSILFTWMLDCQEGIDYWHEKHAVLTKFASANESNHDFNFIDYRDANRYVLEQRASWKALQFISGLGSVATAVAGAGLVYANARNAFRK